MNALLEAWARYGERPALIWQDRPYSYRWLGEQTVGLRTELNHGRRPGAGQVVALAADYSPMSVVWLLALLESRAVVAPLTSAFDAQRPELYALGEVELEVALDSEDEIHQALERALARQVKLRIIIRAENNHFFCDLIARPAFRRLLDEGAEIWAYPGMAHGKILIVDRRHVSVGTANLDRLSLHKISELNVVADDPEFAARTVTEIFERDLEKCDRLGPEDITLIQRLLGTAGRPLAPMV